MGVVSSQLFGLCWDLLLLLWPAQQVLLRLTETLVQLSETHPLSRLRVPGRGCIYKSVCVTVVLLCLYFTLKTLMCEACFSPSLLLCTNKPDSSA